MNEDYSGNHAADVALTTAMYRYTFAVVGNGKSREEGRGIGTGVGVFWNGTFLILSAAHTMHTTPDEQLYFLLPDESLVFEGSSVSSEAQPIRLRSRVQLESQRTIFDDDRDLVAFVLPEQTDEQARQHFYVLNGSETSPKSGDPVGVTGYPEQARVPIGSSFAATPYSTFGEIEDVQNELDCTIAVSYPIKGNLDPHGLSGGGLWSVKSPVGILWTPTIKLAGIATHFDAKREVLLGLAVEELVRFLETRVP